MRISENDKLYSSRILASYLKLLRDDYPSINISNILSYSEINPYEITDETSWFTQRQVDRFYERCVLLSGNSNIARDAGRLASSPGLLGVVQQHTFGVLGPHLAFKILNHICKKVTLSCDYQSKLHSNTKVEITVTPYPGAQEKAYQCESRKGMFECVVTAFNLDLPHIEHPECMFRGDSRCRYIISWKRDLAHRLGILRNIVSSSLATYALFGWYLLPLQTYLAAGGYFLALYFGASYATSFTANSQIARSRNRLSESAEILEELMDANLSNVDLVHQIGCALVNATTVKEVLANAISAMGTSLNFDCGVIMLANDDHTRLIVREVFGFSIQEQSLLEQTAFHLDKPDSLGPFVLSFKEKKPFIVEDAQTHQDKFSERSRQLIENLRVQSFLCCPILVEDQPRGVVAVTNQSSMRALKRSDVYLLQGIAPIIGLALANAELVEHLDERDRLLEEHNKMLESEVSLRTKDLVEARDLALAANNAKSRFLANTNHELRTPLHSILGYTGLLRDELEMDPTLEVVWESYVDTIEKNANILSSMINNLLDLAKIEEGQMPLNLEMVDIRSLINELSTTIRPLMDHNDNVYIVEYKLNNDSMFFLDRSRVLQALLNLLSNAAKFTLNGQVVLKVEVIQKSLKFTVTDTGCGISENEVRSIFDAFTQVDPDASRSSEGTGLGLTITREFVELMRGTISVQSEPGIGSVFMIELPI